MVVSVAEGLCFHVELQVPRYADVGGHVILRCEYSVPSEELHKVEWLRGGKKLFQYVKGRTPPFRNYSTPGAVLDVSTLCQELSHFVIPPPKKNSETMSHRRRSRFKNHT